VVSGGATSEKIGAALAGDGTARDSSGMSGCDAEWEFAGAAELLLEARGGRGGGCESTLLLELGLGT
jgi:hypothetical protein